MVLLTGLAVGENARIVALERVVQNVTTDAVKHLFLRREMCGARVNRIEAMIERKGFRLFAVCVWRKMGRNVGGGMDYGLRITKYYECIRDGSTYRSILSMDDGLCRIVW